MKYLEEKIKNHIHCPICHMINNHEVIRRFKEYSLLYCKNCRVRFWFPLMSPEENCYEEYHLSKDLDIFSPFILGKDHFKFLKSFNLSNKKLLDIGCGTGDFLSIVEKKCYCVGIDISSVAITTARKKHKLKNVYSMNLESFVKEKYEKFDIITLFQVLEHITDVKQFFNLIDKVLLSGGYIVGSVPNGDKWRFKFIFDKGDYPPIHFFLHTNFSLKYLFESNGFSVKTIEYYHTIYNLGYFVSYHLGLHDFGLRIVKKLISKKMQFKSRNEKYYERKFNIKNFVVKTGVDLYKSFFIPIVGMFVSIVQYIFLKNKMYIYFVAQKEINNNV